MPDGLQKYCKPCQRELNRISYANNPAGYDRRNLAAKRGNRAFKVAQGQVRAVRFRQSRRARLPPRGPEGEKGGARLRHRRQLGPGTHPQGTREVRPALRQLPPDRGGRTPQGEAHRIR